MIAFLSPPSPIVRLAGDGYVPVDVRDGEHIGLFASPIVRLAGDGYVPQLGGMTHCNYAKVLGSSSDEPATKNIVQEKNQTIAMTSSMHVEWSCYYEAQDVWHVECFPSCTPLEIRCPVVCRIPINMIYIFFSFFFGAKCQCNQAVDQILVNSANSVKSKFLNKGFGCEGFNSEEIVVSEISKVCREVNSGLDQILFVVTWVLVYH
ncbi:unnamed protein product [Rhizophagus irregularis]|uniref:Uncharacterized protein n=1 Tax=Rhizophagus irregularis TaxID=588596 RepID=A0A915YV60_9GLOM|nr:unnamed protein product [Rhizophagus irregularis]